MLHTNLPQNRVVFLLLCELTRSAIYGSQNLADRVSRRGKRKTVQFPGVIVRIIVLYFYNIFLPVGILSKNGYKHFSKTNSTDPRQRVPLIFFPQNFPVQQFYCKRIFLRTLTNHCMHLVFHIDPEFCGV